MTDRRILEFAPGIEMRDYLSIDFPYTNLSDFDIDKDVLIFANWLDANKLVEIDGLISSGARYIFNNLWESNIDPAALRILSKADPKKGLILNGYHSDAPLARNIHVPMFFWFTESMKYKRPIIDNRLATKKFLLPLNRRRPIRDELIRKLNDQLDDSIYSYVERGRALPNDISPFDDRYYREEWYQDTCFSISVETEPTLKKGCVFLTEKTFKPLSCGHPFIVVGNPGSLKLLRKNGFKTFPELFDETYDEIQSTSDRLAYIIAQIKKFDRSKMAMINETTKHNHQHFNNHSLIKDRMEKEIVDPIKRFIDES